MHPLLKRILAHGLLAAAMLAVIGFGYAELAGLFLAAKAPDRSIMESAATPETDHLAESIQRNVPFMMALWGFLFVAVGEVVMHQIRKRRVPPPEPKPDPALILLEEILAKVESERATVAIIDSSPSPASAENTPVAS